MQKFHFGKKLAFVDLLNHGDNWKASAQCEFYKKPETKESEGQKVGAKRTPKETLCS